MLSDMNELDEKTFDPPNRLRIPRVSGLAKRLSTAGVAVRLFDSQDGRRRCDQHRIDLPRIERAVREILVAIGEDPDREGLLETPRRVARAYREMFAGLGADAGQHLQRTFEHDGEQAVIVGGIDFASTCEHHLLPFFGQAHIAYLPGAGKVAGLSKLARTVDVFARRPQLQERMTEQIAEALSAHLAPRGVCVLVEAEHLCMRLRGACKPRTMTRTLAVRGIYRTDAAARTEAISLMSKGL
jgi:GTP cyclohydrolase I